MIFIILTITIPLALLFIFEGNWPKKVFKWLFNDTTPPVEKGEEPIVSMVWVLAGIPNIWIVGIYILLFIFVLALIGKI